MEATGEVEERGETRRADGQMRVGERRGGDKERRGREGRKTGEEGRRREEERRRRREERRGGGQYIRVRSAGCSVCAGELDTLLEDM